VLVSLDLKGAFDAAWWPSNLNGLKACRYPKKSIQSNEELL